ncbi:MAG: Tim44 domain-containing protein [Deltaproteobacteria bacterium]|nr:Tim44 domain-containing protein [Deltaproteobacteria bacterium]
MFVKRVLAWGVPILALVAFLAVSVDFAEAKRFGGGRSFGSKPSYQKSVTNPQKPAQQSQGQSAGAMNQPGRGLMGGMLGGLLMGGLLGSLFFGGSFMGPGLFDILIIGGLLYLAYRFFKSRKLQERTDSGPEPGPMRRSESGAGWENLRTPPSTGSKSARAVPVPEGFDEREFLEGAKAAFARLQQSWDERDMDDIRQFTSPEVFRTIEDHARQEPGPSRTETLLLEASLYEVRQVGSQTVAGVEFNARIQEDGGPVEQVREIWHFGRYDNDPKASWVLEGIQQVEER